MIPTQAITLHSNGIIRALITPDISVSLSRKIAQVAGLPLQIEVVGGLWDTGASSTSISSRLAQKLGLPVISMATVYDASGPHVVNAYSIDLTIMGNININSCRVTEFTAVRPDFDILIGMDIITLGDFSFTNANKRSMFSFRIPAGNDHVDYVDEINKKQQARKMVKQYNKHNRRR